MKSPNVGIVVSASSRFFTTVQLLQGNVKSHDNLCIIIESPQFHSQFRFNYSIKDKLVTLVSKDGNPFVEKCLSLVFSFARLHLGDESFTDLLTDSAIQGNLGIKLRADNDFYSQIRQLEKRNLLLLSKSLKTLPRFLPCPKGVDGKVDIAKTGMGSSAALTTSLVGALLQWFGIVKLGYRNAEDDRRILHNLAQLAHAIAQEKCGSGFDVSAAVYGSQIYTRFDDAVVQSCMAKHVSSETIYKAVMSSVRKLFSSFFLSSLHFLTVTLIYYYNIECMDSKSVQLKLSTRN